MDTQRIASYRREFSALADLQAAGTVTYSLLREEDSEEKQISLEL